MYFENTLVEIENLLESLERSPTHKNCADIGIMQIFILADIPGYLSRVQTGDISLLKEVERSHEFFLETLDYDGPTFFQKDGVVRLAATKIDSLFCKIINLENAKS